MLFTGTIQADSVNCFEIRARFGIVRPGSTELDSSWPTERDSPVMLSAKSRSPERSEWGSISVPSETDPSLRGGVTRGDCSNGQGLFFTIEPCLRKIKGETQHGRSSYCQRGAHPHR